MASSPRDHILWLLLAGIGAASAAAIVPAISSPTPVDRALPWIALAVCVAAWLTRRSRVAALAALALPALLISAVAAAGERERLLGYGVGFAFSVTCAAIAVNREGGVERKDAVVLLLLIALPFRFLGVDWSEVPSAIAVVAGCLVLTLCRPGWNMLFLGAAVAVATPAEPLRVALFPWILAALAAPLPGLWPIAAVLPLGLLAGRWALPFVLIAAIRAVLEILQTRRGTLPMLAAVYARPLSAAIALRPVAFMPEAFGRLDASTITGLAVVVGAMFLRPPVALLYALGGIAIAASRPKEDRVSSSAVLIGVVMLALLPWGGMLAGAFPLPLPLPSLASLALIAVIAAWKGPAALRVLSVLALAAFVIRGELITRGAWSPAIAVLGPGESATFHPEAGPRLEMAMSGGNVARLRRGTVLGTLDLIDVRGNGYRRQIVAGEISDWAAFRRGEYWRAENGLPAVPNGPIEGHGANAYAVGAGRIEAEIPAGIATVRVSVSQDLPPASRLHVDAMRVSGR